MGHADERILVSGEVGVSVVAPEACHGDDDATRQ
jgi:hypothetical protein